MRVKTQKGNSPEWTVCLKDTPLGPLFLTFTDRGLAALDFAEEGGGTLPGATPPAALGAMIEATKQALDRYFHEGAADFRHLPLDLRGTAFQQKVWRELQLIPRDQAISYRELAQRVGSPQGFRAVGQANGRNPVPIIIPCHRVIKADGSLGGYSSGVERKRWLLKHEGAM